MKAEIEAILQQMVKAKKNEHVNALKEAKHFCTEFGFNANKLKGVHTKGCCKK